MLTTERFIEDCREALKEKNAQAAVKELVNRAVSDPTQLMRAIGEPQRAGVETLYKADDLTILNLCWGPRMSVTPHNHCMWAVIGIYGGRELNTFYRRGDKGLVKHGNKEMNAGDTAPLGETIIHEVHNPLDQITGAIHVYGGDFFNEPRSEWTADTLEERVYEVANTMRAFEESNALLDELAAARS